MIGSSNAFAGRTALVTGAAHGIGEAIAHRLIGAGARVVVLDGDAGGLARSYAGVDCVQLVTPLGVVDPGELADRVLAEHGPVEIIVHNAPASTQRRFLQEVDDASFALVHRVLVADPMFMTRRFVEALIAGRRRGCVLFISSLHATFVRLYPSYSVGKAGVAMLVKEMAYELAPHGIRVNALSPGWIETAKPGEPTIPEQGAADLIPMGRFGTPDDVARIAVTLLDDDWSSYVTGTNVVVDGGLALHNWLMDV